MGATLSRFLLELADENGASYIRKLHIEILRDKSGTPEHMNPFAPFGSGGLFSPL